MVLRVLLSIGVFCAALSQSQAETLSDNLDQPTTYTELVSGSDWIGASFGTGGTASTLGGVTLLLQSNTPGGSLSLNLFSASNTQPATLIGQLSAPSAYSSSLAPVTFGGAGLALAANSTYWLVAEAPSGEFEWAYTDSNNGTGVGFQHTWGYSEDAGDTWFTSDLAPVQMQVTDISASAVPEPASLSLLLIGGTAYLAIRRRRLS